MESTFTKNERNFFTPVPGAPQGACGSEKSAGRYIVKKLWITADRCCFRWIFIESLAISWQKQYNKTNFESSHRQPGGLIMASKINKGEILAKFFDDGEYTALFADGAVSAACGYAAGQQAYAVYQNGEAVTVKDVEKNIKVLEMAAQTGCPVVTFYNSVGAKLAEGLDVLTTNAKLNAQIAKVSGVIPQVAVVLGVCGGTSALSAANADVCIMAEGAELFFTAPFTSAAKGDKVADAGSAAAAAKAGVASIVAADVAEAAEKAAHIVGLLPANNLTGPAIFEFEQPTAALAAGAEPAKAAAAVVDKDSTVELYAGFGKSVYTAFATVGGNAVGVVATGKNLCHNCVAKIARFVRLCDAFSVPVVTVVDTEGFVPSVSDDIAGGIREAARLAATYADATTAKVTVLAGKAVGPVYTALAAADLRIAVTGCVVSALEPSAAVSVLYKDEIDASDNIIAATNAKAAAYTAEVCSAANAVACGAADMVCDAANVRSSVVAALELLSTKRAARLPKKHGNMAL
jgi:acetyl-CoA carboxylase carboxyltransferase component